MTDISSARDCKFSKTRYTRILFNIGLAQYPSIQEDLRTICT